MVGHISPHYSHRLTRTGGFDVHIQDFTKCYPVSVNNVRHMTWTCHLPTLNHTSTHILGTHAGFRVIPTLRRSFSSETLDRGDPQIYPDSFLRTRVDQWTFSLYLCLFSTYVHGEPMLDTS